MLYWSRQLKKTQCLYSQEAPVRDSTHVIYSYFPYCCISSSSATTKERKMEENTNFKKKRTVMIAMDGSKHSEYAFKWYAENLHRKTDEVVISHCAEQVEMPPPTLMEPKDTLNEQLAWTREEKNKATRQTLQELANKFQINHKIQQLQGHPGLAIVKAAEENNAGMVICGSRGMGFIRRTIIGSVSDYILHHARMPVIICKNEEEQEKLKNWSLF